MKRTKEYTYRRNWSTSESVKAFSLANESKVTARRPPSQIASLRFLPSYARRRPTTKKHVQRVKRPAGKSERRGETVDRAEQRKRPCWTKVNGQRKRSRLGQQER